MTVPIQDHSSGIDGEVVLRPVLPVEWPGAMGQRPYEAVITIMDAVGRVVAQVRSDADGRFAAALEPGTYCLRPESEAALPHAPMQTVVVQQSRRTPVSIVYDSGIR